MKTAFIIRMHFPKDDPRFDWRLSFFKSMVLPRLLSQTDQDFDICIRVNQHHKQYIENIHPKIKTFQSVNFENKIHQRYKHKIGKYFVDFIRQEDLVGLDKYEIQIGLDSDDLILRDDFIERIKLECKNTDHSLHISFFPHIFDVKNLRMFECPTPYGPQKGSPIFAIYQPKKHKKYYYAYHESHLTLPKRFKQAKRINEDFCCYCVHDNNSSTFLLPNLQQILR